MTVNSTPPQPDPFQKAREALYNRIWFTRKARIQSEKRLLQNDFHAQLMLQLFSAYSIGLSIYLLKFHAARLSDDAANVTLIVVSVLLFGIAPYISARNFKGRAEEFKTVYVKLQTLLDDLNRIDWTSSIESAHLEYEMVEKEYARTLASSENHLEIDDAVSRFGVTGISRPLSKRECIAVILFFSRRWFVWIGGYIVPPVFFVVYSLFFK
ncbi:SLATT domain-containing protein [Burkholderia guangdongensis]|uniref:SLATT domain-containing protein n=1 Tax=Burkholderia guangdongensis TaxID=1792500 RepID=UPI0015CBA4E1|nr:SLATT domain-containing protein [Burkholderia guangdongensis]